MGEFLVLLQIIGFLWIRDIWCGKHSIRQKMSIIFLGVIPTIIYISIYIKPLTENDFQTKFDYIINER